MKSTEDMFSESIEVIQNEVQAISQGLMEVNDILGLPTEQESLCL